MEFSITDYYLVTRMDMVQNRLSTKPTDITFPVKRVLLLT